MVAWIDLDQVCGSVKKYKCLYLCVRNILLHVYGWCLINLVVILTEFLGDEN